MKQLYQTWRKRDRAGAYSRSSFSLLLHACLLLGYCCCGQLSPVLAQTSTINREYPLKVAYLYNFGSYVEWPASAFSTPESPFVLGVLGDNPFGGLLDEVAATKKIQGRPIEIRYLASPEAVTSCQLVFIAAGASDAERSAAIEATGSLPILVVSESPGMAMHGAVINFFVEKNKIRFEINGEAAQEHELTISSKLLSLARLIGAEDAK